MKAREKREVLASMEVIVDTREQPTERAKKRYERFGFPYLRSTLSYGDYTYNATLPNGDKLYDTSESISPKCVIERKMDLDELAGCFCRGRKRFVAEFEKATDHGASIYLIVENASWENLLNGKYRTKMGVEAFVSSLLSFMMRYHMVVLFCKEETSGVLIREILYRDLKERIEKGDFDE